MAPRKPDAAVVTGAQTLMRALDIMDCFADGKAELTLTEIARDLGLTAPTTHRLLKALVSRSMLVYDGDRFYSLGPSVMRLATAMMQRSDDLVRICLPALQRLRKRTGETTALYRVVGAERLCVAELVSLHPIRMESGVGHTYPLLVGAAGKVLLAWDPQLLDHPGLVGTATRRKAVEAQLPAVRDAGFAASFGEVVPGAASLCVPLFDARSRVIAAIGVAGPAERWDMTAMTRNLPAVLKEAKQLTPQLGPFVASAELS